MIVEKEGINVNWWEMEVKTGKSKTLEDVAIVKDSFLEDRGHVSDGVLRKGKENFKILFKDLLKEDSRSLMRKLQVMFGQEEENDASADLLEKEFIGKSGNKKKEKNMVKESEGGRRFTRSILQPIEKNGAKIGVRHTSKNSSK